MAQGGRPACMGQNGLTLACSVLILFSFAPCARNSLHFLLLLADMNQSGAGRPKKWPKIFENFCKVLLNADFQKSNMLWLKTNMFMQRQSKAYAKKI